MSALLRLLRSTQTSSPLQTLRSSRPIQSRMSNYFSPSHSPFPQARTIGLPRSRFYSSFQHGSSQEAANIKVLYSLIGVNVAVFGYGMYAKAQAQSGFPGPFMNFMRNMTINLTDTIHNGMWWTSITSTFTHLGLVHVAGNLFTAYFLGGFLCASPIITPSRLLTIALGAGVTGSIGFLYQRYLVTRGQGIDVQRGLGFSGAVMGITSVAACLNPTATVLIYGIVPMPLWALTLGYAFYDGYYLNEKNSQIGHAGHLGGMVFGIGYYLLKLRGLRV
jgi:membrane associated rhomboid family serine protease